MPSYLDFETTKHFRDFILAKTLSAPNGPKTFTAANYSVQTTREMANTDPGTVDSGLGGELLQSQNSNVFKPLEYSVKDALITIPRKANLSLYPYFQTDQDHNLIGIMSTNTYTDESELFKFAAFNIKNNPNGPFFARLQQNLYSATVGRVRLIDALQGNTSTAINIITGREPLVEKNQKITVASSLPGKAIDFLQTVGGVEFPFAEIPGDYLSNPHNPVIARPTATTQAGAFFQDLTGAIGSLVGIQRRPTTTKKPSDLFIEYMGSGPKSTLYDNLSYSKYAPNYTTTARSQNTSKIFNFVDNLAMGVKNLLGIEAPAGVAYIGDDRGNDVKFAMGDFFDRPVRGPYYLSLMFDPIQAQLFQRTKNIGEGGGIGGKLTWISKNSKNKLGANNTEFSSEQSQFSDSLSTTHTFRDDSILGLTQQILDTLPTDAGAARSHVANVIDQTSRVFREGDVMISRGSAVKYTNQFTGAESGVEYCRVWTKDRSYMNYSDTMKRTTLSRKFESSVLSTPWNLNIYPNSNGNGGFDGSTNIATGGFDNKVGGVKDGMGFYAKKYMFSIENLAWKTSNSPGFTYNDLPYCERGPNGGRVMWFPPYDLKVSEQNSAKWESNIFLGRPEPVYTYQNTERSGQVSFKVIVDHPSILNLLVQNHFKGMSDEEADNYINAFFAGCQDVDFYGLIRKYTTLTPSDVESIKAYLNKNKDPKVVTKHKTILYPVPDPVVPKNQPVTVNFSTELYFKNDKPSSSGEDLYTTERYQGLYDSYISAQSDYMVLLNQGLLKLESAPWGDPQRNDYRVLTGVQSPTQPTPAEFTTMNSDVTTKINDAFTKLQSYFGTYKDGITQLKAALESNTVQSIDVVMGSRTSSIADDHYNLDLSYRRSYSIITDILDKISKDGASKIPISKVRWTGNPKPGDKQKTEAPITITLKDLGYSGEGNFTIRRVDNIGEQPIGTPQSGTVTIDCSDANKIVTSSALKQTAPITFWCRETSVGVTYTTQQPDVLSTTVPTSTPTITEYTDTPTAAPQTPPLDQLKEIVMRTLSECYYFKKLEEESPIQFSSLREKLRYFHPAFHSMTPEGLNARLTFLNQCVRPGDTLPIKGISDISDLNARNTTFGPPPILVMRVGDFYHSKIIVRDVNITYEDGLWDLNPEGIGVQPMIANVTLQVNFIGGHGLEKPVERLQNALSSNFYANTEVYDPRSIATEDRSKFTKEFLEDLIRPVEAPVVADPKDTVTATDNINQGTFIGVSSGIGLAPPPGSTAPLNSPKTFDYSDLIQSLYDETTMYYSNYISAYNMVLGTYGNKLSTILLSPTYRSINNYTVETGVGTNTIQLIGNYKKGSEIEILSADFKRQMLGKIATENISALIGFNKDMSASLLVASEQMLNPYVSKTVGDIIDGMTKSSINSIESTRNKLITILDKLNFVVKVGHDGSITKDVYTGANLMSFSSTQLYGKYSNVVSFMTDNNTVFTKDLDESFTFGSNAVISTNDLSYFLSILLNSKKIEILALYKSNKSFTERMVTDLGKRLDKFLVPKPKDTDFSKIIKKYPVKKDGNRVSYNVQDYNYTFTDPEKDMLKSVNQTSGNNTTTVLNFFR